MKRLFTFFLSLVMILLCFPVGVSADEITLHEMKFYAGDGKIMTSDFGERQENPYTYLVSEGKQIGMIVWAISNDSDKVFVGWATSEGGEVVYEEYDLYDYVPTDNMSFYAVYSDCYTLTLNANGGYFMGDPEEIQMEFQIPKEHEVNGNYSMPDYPDSSMSLKGWAKTPDGEAIYPKYLYDYLMTEDTVLYAIWGKTITVTLDANGGYFKYHDKNTVETVTLAEGTELDFYDAMVIDNPNKVFAGWSHNPKGPVEIEEHELYKYTPSESETLYAIWEDGFSITYVTDEGYFVDYETIGNQSQEITLKFLKDDFAYAPTPENPDPNRAVAGWSYTKGGNPDLMPYEVFDLKPDKSITLYAVWTKGYRVTLNANGGNYGYSGIGDEMITEMVVSIPEGGFLWSYAVPDGPDGKSFMGWSLTPDGAEIEDMSQVKVNSEMTLYAVYGEKVERIYGDSRFDTSMRIAREYMDMIGKNKLNAVILTSGTGYADALAGSYLAYVKGAPILITSELFGGYPYYKDVNSFIQNFLRPGGTIYVLGGETAVPNKVVEGLKGFNIIRLDGVNRYETNIKILEEAGVKDEDILVCTGYGFADSLSASAAKRPILLVGNSLNDMQKEYLSKHTKNKYYAIGGENAVTKGVVDQLSAYGKVTRLAGATRHETSVMIAEEFCKDATDVVLAYSYNFPDGLCGGPLAAAMNAPIILTRDGNEDIAAAWYKKHNIEFGLVLGGPGLISDRAALKVFNK